MIGFILYILFMVSYFLHLPSRVPVIGEWRLEFLLGAVLLIGAVVTGSFGRAWAVRSHVFRRLVWLIAFIVLSIPLVTWPGSVIRFNLINYIKVVFFFIITVAFVDSEKRLKWFLFIFVFCQLLRIGEPLYLHLTTGYWGDFAYSHVGGEITVLKRLAGAPHDIVNSNQLAWVIVSTVPFIYYMGVRSKKILLNILCVPVLVALGYALFLTGSRSGLVCLTVVIFCIAWFGPGRARRIALISAMLLPLIFVGVDRLDINMLTRYRSLIDHSVAGGDTAVGRIYGVMSNMRTIVENPIFGHGVGTSRETNYNAHGGHVQVTHNLYIESIQEIGVVGFILLLLYLQSIGSSLIRTNRFFSCGNSTSLSRLTQATLVWFIMNVIYSFSCYGLSSWEWYFFGGITHVSWVLSRKYINTKPVATAA